MRIVILGAGEIGYHIALSLSRENREVLLVESNSGRASQIEEDENDIQVIRGNAADPDVLIRAGIKNVDLLVAVTDSDEVNITACMFAKRLAPTVRRVARIRQLDTRRHGRLLTDDPPLMHSVIHPEELCAAKIGDLIKYPGTTDVNWFFGGRVALVSMPVTPDSPINGRTLLQIGRERSVHGIPFMIASLLRNQIAALPSAGDRLATGDVLYVATLSERLGEVLNLFCAPARLKPIRNVTIFGGGRIGLYLAEMLESINGKVKLIEPDERRAALLADHLQNTLILCGEPSDRGIFDEENIAQSDAFIAVTGDQEDNMIAALYAKSSGVRFGAVTLHRSHLSSLVQRVGIDAVILPQQVAIGKILEHVRAGNVSSVVVLEQYGMEVIEAPVPSGSRLLGKPLRDLRLPSGALLLALCRENDETVIPDGDTTIMAGDRIAVISHQRDVHEIEKILRGERRWG